MSELKRFEVFARITRVQSGGVFEAENAEEACKIADKEVDWLDILGVNDEDDPETYAKEVEA